MKTETFPRITDGLGQLVLCLLPILCLVLTTLPSLGQDPFTMVTNGPLVTETGDFGGAAWGDYDDDGFPDIMVSRGYFGSTYGLASSWNLLCHNEGNGTFSMVTNTPITLDRGYSALGTWGDYDNDGRLDLYVGLALPLTGVRTNGLYRNLGGGQFEKVTTGPLVVNTHIAGSSAWVDYNRDGWLDLFVVSAWTTWQGVNINTPNSLYRNRGDGSFTFVTNAPIGTDIFNCEWAAWGDYDNDGRLDLVASRFFLRFYHQDTDSVFSIADTKPRSGPPFSGIAWGDYDNDGLLDLLQCQFLTNRALLFRNLGGGQFEQLSIPSGPNDQLCAWGDFDNDGYLDLVVTEGGDVTDYNRLYRNNRDGTLTQFTRGESVVTDPVRSPFGFGCSWADYDNNGFLDLIVCRAAQTQVGAQNFLYHNNGNGNHWLLLRLKGTVSNRAAIGTRVKVLATIWGKEVSQMRDVGMSASLNQGDLRPHFGLGDATNITTLRIEWPSGIVQTLTNVASDQILLLLEPRRPVLFLEATPGGFAGTLKADTNQTYQVHASEDPAAGWSVLTNVTSDATGTAYWSDPGVAPQGRRFYKAVKTP